MDWLWCHWTVPHFFVCANVNISETVRASSKIYRLTFVHFDICHRMASFAKIVLHDFTYFLISKIWNVNVSEIIRDSAKIYRRTFVDFNIFRRMTTLQQLHSVLGLYHQWLKYKTQEPPRAACEVACPSTNPERSSSSSPSLTIFYSNYFQKTTRLWRYIATCADVP